MYNLAVIKLNWIECINFFQYKCTLSNHYTYMCVIIIGNYSYKGEDPRKSLVYPAGLPLQKMAIKQIITTYNYICTQYLYIILIWTFVINNEGDSEWKESIVYNDG